MTTMKAAVIYEAGGPEVLKLEDRPIPAPRPGEILIRVKAFGLNRSELFTRQGLSPGVSFPRILGIEAVGLVEEAPGGEFTRSEIVVHRVEASADARLACQAHLLGRPVSVRRVYPAFVDAEAARDPGSWLPETEPDVEAVP